MSEKKSNIPLIIALSIPVLMIVLTAVSIYLPSLFVKPTTDFIYSNDREYYSKYKYSVKNGKIIQNEVQQPANESSRPQYTHEPSLYYYDVQRDSARQISFEEAEQLNLDSSFKSQDGFQIVSGHGNYDFFFFGGGSYYDKYLQKKAFSRRLEVGQDYNFHFIGWVKE